MCSVATGMVDYPLPPLSTALPSFLSIPLSDSPFLLHASLLSPGFYVARSSTARVHRLADVGLLDVFSLVVRALAPLHAVQQREYDGSEPSHNLTCILFLSRVQCLAAPADAE